LRACSYWFSSGLEENSKRTAYNDKREDKKAD